MDEHTPAGARRHERRRPGARRRAGRAPARAAAAAGLAGLLTVAIPHSTGAAESGAGNDPGPHEGGDRTEVPHDLTAAEGDGGALAWWIAGEAALLVVGCAVWCPRTAAPQRPLVDVAPDVGRGLPKDLGATHDPPGRGNLSRRPRRVRL